MPISSASNPSTEQATPSLPAFRHDHVALRANDLDATVRWYVEHLGFEDVQRWPSGDLRLAYLVRGDVKLEVLGGPGAAAGATAEALADTFAVEGIHHLCLAVDDLDALVAALEGRGVPCLAEPFVVADIGRRLAFVQDPSGNLIEFSAPASVQAPAPAAGGASAA